MTEPESSTDPSSRMKLVEELEELEKSRRSRIVTVLSKNNPSLEAGYMKMFETADKFYDSCHNLTPAPLGSIASDESHVPGFGVLKTEWYVLEMPTEPAYLPLFYDLCVLMAVSRRAVSPPVGGVILSLLLVLEKDFSNTQCVKLELSNFGVEIVLIPFHDPATVLSCINVEDEYWKARLLQHTNLAQWPPAAEKQLFLRGIKTPIVNWPIVSSIGKEDFQIYISVIFAALLKEANGRNLNGWLTNRIQDFAGAFGFQSCVFKPSHFPDAEFFAAVYSDMQYHNDLRSEVFQLYMKISKGPDSNPWKKACTVLVENAKWSGMMYFYMIEEFIVKRHPFILKLLTLAGQASQLCTAYRMLYAMGLPEEMWPYVKILKPQNEWVFLKRKNYVLLTAIAQEIGKEISPSLVNYKANEQPLTPFMEKRVRNVVSLIKRGSDGAGADSN